MKNLSNHFWEYPIQGFANNLWECRQLAWERKAILQSTGSHSQLGYTTNYSFTLSLWLKLISPVMFITQQLGHATNWAMHPICPTLPIDHTHPVSQASPLFSSNTSWHLLTPWCFLLIAASTELFLLSDLDIYTKKYCSEWNTCRCILILLHIFLK